LHNGDVLPKFDVNNSDRAKLGLVHEGCYPLDRKGRGRSSVDTAMLIQQRARASQKLLSMDFFPR
jgi:hypothetical protein